MGEISGIVHFSDETFPGSNATGGRHLIIGVLPNGNVHRVKIFVFFRNLGHNINKDSIRVDPAEFLVAVAFMLRENADQSTFFQFFYVTGESSIGNSQTSGDLIHIHFALFQKQFNDLDPKFRPQGFIEVYTIFNFFNVQHRRTPLSLRCYR